MKYVEKKGVFICVEGIDGSGKTTQARRLVETLKKHGYDAVYTTEPSEGYIGKILRKHILQGDKRVPVIVEAVLFAADRVDHAENEIKPFLKAGKTVVCDRYIHSSISYQGAADLELEWISKINDQVVKPDLAIYIDVPPEVVIGRIRRRKSVMETLHTQKKVRKVYLQLVKQKQLITVNGNAALEQVAGAIADVALEYLKKHEAAAKSC